MPEARMAPSADNRNLVDRLLDRIRNNRIAAVAIIGCMAIVGAASLTDAARKLGSLLALSSDPSVAGEWKSTAADAYYPFSGREFVRLNLQEPTDDLLVGSVQFGGNAQRPARSFPIIEGKRSGDSVSVVFDSGYRLRETLVGELHGGELRLVYQRPGSGAIAVTAQRLAQSAQLVDGRFGILYKGKEYPDHQAACSQLLKELDPPQDYKSSEPPDENGHVHCVGQFANGHEGFNQFQNEVQRELVCPANSRAALVEQPGPAKGCECDGDMVVSSGKCVPHT